MADVMSLFRYTLLTAFLSVVIAGDLAAVQELLLQAGADTNKAGGGDGASDDARRKISSAAVVRDAQPGKQERVDPFSKPGSELSFFQHWVARQ